jgi:hypothetical protein
MKFIKKLATFGFFMNHLVMCLRYGLMDNIATYLKIIRQRRKIMNPYLSRNE